MAKHQTRNILFIVFAIAIISSMIFFLFPAQESGALNIRIPSLSVIQTPEGAIPAGEINCNLRQTTQIHSRTGAILETLESDVLVGIPFVQLQFPIVTANTLDEISYFSVTPKIFCTQSSGQRVHAESPTLQLTVWGQGHRFFPLTQFTPLTPVPQSDPFLAWSLDSSALTTFGTGQAEQAIGIFIVRDSDFESFTQFPQQDFEFNLEFAITGSIDIFYPDSPNCPDCSQFKFNFPIQRNDINTFYTTTVLLAPPIILDSDNDGIIDANDQCPNEPENFNGFQDSDGCPDLPSGDTPPTTSEPEEMIIVLGDMIIIPNTCEATGDPVLCQQECEQRGGTWTPQEGAGLAPICITNVVLPPEVVEEIISEPSVIDAIIEVFTGEPTEVIRLSEGGIVVTQDPTTGELTTRLATEIPPPVFELEQEIPEPQQLPSETREIRPPMVDDIFLIVIVILLLIGFIAIVIISRFTKL